MTAADKKDSSVSGADSAGSIHDDSRLAHSVLNVKNEDGKSVLPAGTIGMIRRQNNGKCPKNTLVDCKRFSVTRRGLSKIDRDEFSQAGIPNPAMADATTQASRAPFTACPATIFPTETPVKDVNDHPFWLSALGPSQNREALGSTTATTLDSG